MEHPGPPRFVATGDSVELAPRDPNPDATYTWSIVTAPEESTVTLGSDPVEHLVPDEPGTYVVRVSGPGGDHDLTIRAFPGRMATGSGVGGSGASGGQSGSGPGRSGQWSGSARPTSGAGSGGTAERGSGGRPRVTLSAAVEGDEVVVTATPEPNPESDEDTADLNVEFLLDDRDDVDRAAVRETDRELAVPLAALPDRLRVYAVAVGQDGYSVPDAIEVGAAETDVAADSGRRTDGRPGAGDATDGGS